MNTPQEMIEVCEAFRDGKEIQGEYGKGDWFDCGGIRPNFASRRYRVKPTPKLKRVPLGPEDFPPGTVVRRTGKLAGYRVILECADDHLRISGNGGAHTSYDSSEMFGNYIRLLPGTTEWLPCYKEVEA